MENSLLSEDSIDLARRSKDLPGFERYHQRFVEHWVEILDGLCADSTSSYEAIVLEHDEGLSTGVLSELSKEMFTANGVSCEEGSQPCKAQFDWIVGYSLAFASLGPFKDGKGRFVEATALAFHAGLRRIGFIDALRELLMEPARNTIVGALEALAKEIAQSPENGGMRSDQREAYRSILSDWYKAPSLDEIWYSHSFEYFINADYCEGAFATLRDIDPALYLSLLERTRSPAFVGFALAIRSDTDTILDTVTLLAHAPDCFEFEPSAGCYRYNGALTAPLLIQKIFDTCSRRLSCSRDDPSAIGEFELKDGMEALAQTVADSENASVLATHLVAWLLWRLWRSNSHVSSERYKVEDLAINAICAKFADSPDPFPSAGEVSSRLIGIEHDVLKEVRETGCSLKDTNNERRSRFDLLAAYAALSLSLDENTAEEARAEYARSCLTLYRDYLIADSSYMAASPIYLTHSILAYMFRENEAPYEQWIEIWNELAQRRHRYWYDLGKGHGRLDSSFFHISVGIELIDWAISEDETLPVNLPLFWRELFDAIRSCNMHGIGSNLDIRSHLYSLVGRTRYLVAKGPSATWYETVASGLVAASSDGMLLTSLVESLILNSADIAEISNHYFEQTGDKLPKLINDYLLWDSNKIDQQKVFNTSARREIKHGLDMTS